MKETTCQKLQEIGAFALAGGCNGKRMKQLVEMIRAARNYRGSAFTDHQDEFVILARKRATTAAVRYAGVCGAGWTGQTDYCRRRAQDPRHLPVIRRVERSLSR
jgi:hypothetical protein